MKIAFFGLTDAFDYFHIGGVESFIRRLTTNLVEAGNEVDYILYGKNIDKTVLLLRGLNLRYFKSFDDALNVIDGSYAHVITTYIPLKNRLKNALFRQKHKLSINFHTVFFGWPDSLIKRKLYFGEARVFSFNGKLFCISPRQYEYVSKWSGNAVSLMPPVPESYFLRTTEKPLNDKIKVTFLGRIDPGKGINGLIEIFKALKGDERFECCIYGIHIPENKESLAIHNWLKSQEEIQYIEVERQKYSPAVEEMTKNVFRNTDILILPYKQLSSTIDTPVTILEAMASLCCVITKTFGNIPNIYGKSKFLINPDNFISNAIQLIKNITYQDILEERKRIYEKNLILNFNCANISRRFFDALNL